MLRSLFYFCAISLVFLITEGLLQPLKKCPGESRFADGKCDHSDTHAICAQLLDNKTHKPLLWGKKNFWQLTQQTKSMDKWISRMSDPRNPGGSWCICMWATADLID